MWRGCFGAWCDRQNVAGTTSDEECSREEHSGAIKTVSAPRQLLHALSKSLDVHNKHGGHGRHGRHSSSSGPGQGDADALENKLGLFLMEHVPSIVTLFNVQGNISYQNHASRAYLGDVQATFMAAQPARRHRQPRTSSGDSAWMQCKPQKAKGRAHGSSGGGGRKGGRVSEPSSARGVASDEMLASQLGQLFKLDEAKLEQMLAALKQGQKWEGTVQMAPAGRVFPAATPAVQSLRQPQAFQESPRRPASSMSQRRASLPSLPSSTPSPRDETQTASSATSVMSAKDEYKSWLMGGPAPWPPTPPSGGVERSTQSCAVAQGPLSSPELQQLPVRRLMPSSSLKDSLMERSQTKGLDLFLLNPLHASEARHRSMKLASSLEATLPRQSLQSSSWMSSCSLAPCVWHHVVAKAVRDPVQGHDWIMLTHSDVTRKVESEQRATALLEAEHAILEQVFPRHVIERMAAGYSKRASLDQRLSLDQRASLEQRASVDKGRSPEQGSSIDQRSSFDQRAIEQLISSMSDRSLVCPTPARRPPPSPVAGADAALSNERVRHTTGHSTVPSAAAQLLTPGAESFSTYHEQVTIMFADIVGFTSMCSCVPPATVMAVLNKMFSAFDDLLSIFNVYKVETAGDCYIVAGGLMHKDCDGYTSVRPDVAPLQALTVLEFAKAMLQKSSKMLNPATGKALELRIGMHSGPVVSGIVGLKMPRFCLFGDSMNTAQRMESASRPGCIHVSEATRRLLPKEQWEPTGGVELKGLGVCPSHFWVPTPSRHPQHDFQQHSAVSNVQHARPYLRKHSCLDKEILGARHAPSGDSSGSLRHSATYMSLSLWSEAAGGTAARPPASRPTAQEAARAAAAALGVAPCVPSQEAIRCSLIPPPEPHAWFGAWYDE